MNPDTMTNHELDRMMAEVCGYKFKDIGDGKDFEFPAYIVDGDTVAVIPGENIAVRAWSPTQSGNDCGECMGEFTSNPYTRIQIERLLDGKYYASAERVNGKVWCVYGVGRGATIWLAVCRAIARAWEGKK